MTNTAENNKRIAKNTLLLYFRMLLTMAVTLYTSRVILATLGIEDFGIYNAVAGFITMFTSITGAMSTATQRFLTYALGEKNTKQLAKTFNMAIEIHILMAIIILILGESIGVWFLYEKMTIPIERLQAAFWVLQSAIFSTMIMLVSIPYNALIIAHEKMQTFAWISIIEVVLKLLIVFLLNISPIDKLILYSFMLLGVQLIIRILYGTYCKHSFSESNFHFIWNRTMFKNMSSFAGWSLFGCLAGAGQTQGLNILLNIFFGPTVNAARGITVQVQNAIQGFATNFQTALNPQITKSYAAYNWDYTKFLLFLSSRVSIFLLFIISLPVLLETNQILTWWLDTPPDYTDKFIKIILLITMIDALANPIIVAAQATGKIKKYQMTVGGCLLLTPVMAYIALKLTHEPTMVFITQLCIAIIAQFIRIMIIKKMLNFSMQEYFKSTVMPIFKACLPAFCICWGITYLLEESFVRFFTTILSSVIINVIFIWFFGFNKNERKQISVVIKQKIKKGK